MKEKNKFRYAEKCLYDYKRNIAALDVLREDLRVEKAGTDVHAQNYQFSFGFNGTPSNPVEARLLKIENIENKIKMLERYTKPITQMIDDLTAPENLEGSDNNILMNILKLMYFGKNKPYVIRDELNICKRTFSLKRRELIDMVKGYLAL